MRHEFTRLCERSDQRISLRDATSPLVGEVGSPAIRVRGTIRERAYFPLRRLYQPVVPANAGTHSHRRLWLRQVSSFFALWRSRSVWGPAFAGPTKVAVRIKPSSPKHLCRGRRSVSPHFPPPLTLPPRTR